MNATPPTYDLISSLRILYRRRYLIVTGTFLVTVAVAVASLVWPQTWRAESFILVTTPEFKNKLTLLSRPLDVVAYRSLLADQAMLSTVLERLRWMNSNLQTVLNDPDKKKILLENLGLKEDEIDNYRLIERTNLPKLARVLFEEAQELHAEGADSPGLQDSYDDRVRLLSLITPMNADEIEAVVTMDPQFLADLTIFDLRKMLSATVTKVKETNLETEYSPIIDVRGELDTAAGAKMITNLWVRCFLDRVEQIVRQEILNRTDQVSERAREIDGQLQKAYRALHALRASSAVDDLKAELASKRLLLYGVAEARSDRSEKQNEFDLEEENLPFLTESLRHESLASFEMQPNYPDALLPQLAGTERLLEEKKAFLKQLESGEVASERTADLKTNLAAEIARLEASTGGFQQQATSLTGEIDLLRGRVETGESEIEALCREIRTLENQAVGLQRLVQEVDMLIGGMKEGRRFSDAQAGTAVKPDKRVSPKRTYMTAGGMIVSFVLLCGLAFFLEIWPKITAES